MKHSPMGINRSLYSLKIVNLRETQEIVSLKETQKILELLPGSITSRFLFDQSKRAFDLPKEPLDQSKLEN